MTRSPGRAGHAWRQARQWVIDNYDYCWWCLHPVDKTLSGRDPMGPSADHDPPLSRGGDPLDRSKLKLAHMRCNSQRGNRLTKPRRSRAW